MQKHLLALAAASLLPAAALAQSSAPGSWQYHGSVYAYGPSIDGKTTFPTLPGGGDSSGINVTPETILDHLKFTFMGSIEAHNGRWGIFSDFIYLDLGGGKSQTRDFTIGNIGLPASTNANLNFDLKATVWSIAGEYRLVSDPAFKLDLLAGTRYIDFTQTLRWEISGELGPISGTRRSGEAKASMNAWDAIVGVKGQYRFGETGKWFAPLYLDVGTGQSDLTMQAAGGLGYSFSWGEVIALWRYVDYEFKSGKPVQAMAFNGPMIGAGFRW